MFEIRFLFIKMLRKNKTILVWNTKLKMFVANDKSFRNDNDKK